MEYILTFIGLAILIVFSFAFWGNAISKDLAEIKQLIKQRSK